MGRGTIADPGILARKQGNQRFVLPEGHAGKSPDAAIGRASYSKARAGDRGVVGPRIVLKGVKQPRQFGEQSLIRVLKLAALMKGCGQKLAFFVEIDASENRLSAGLECGQVLGDPIRPHLAIGVGCQDHAVPLASFDKPGLGKIHRRTASVASVRRRRRQSGFDNTNA